MLLLAHARGLPESAWMPEKSASLCVVMIAPLLGGILFGPWVGFHVGWSGSLLVLLSPLPVPVPLAFTLSSALVGYLAGALACRCGDGIASLSLLIGQLCLSGIATFERSWDPFLLTQWHTWQAMTVEVFFCILACLALVAVYDAARDEHRQKS